jgi:hypothetical protein
MQSGLASFARLLIPLQASADNLCMRILTPGRFDAAALYAALDAQRKARGMAWTQVGNEIGVSPCTIMRTRLGGRMEVDGMLAMVRWAGGAPFDPP